MSVSSRSDHVWKIPKQSVFETMDIRELCGETALYNGSKQEVTEPDPSSVTTNYLSPAETSPSAHVVSISGKAKLGHHQIGEAKRHESIDFGQPVQAI